MKRRKTEAELIEERKHKYGCNGHCYGGDGCPICGGIDTCDETRIQEGIATLIATLTVMIVPLSLLLCAIFIVVKIFGWIGGILF